MRNINDLPMPADDLIAQLCLQKHPDGGYFIETSREVQEIASPYADGASRNLATSIFYLLTYEEPGGAFHMNKSVTHHVWHHGRVEYTLITPCTPPKIQTVILGANAAAGEQRQLIVGTGVWKRSNLLRSDIAAATTPEQQAHLGCLITVIVTPGFHWEDHSYMSKEDLWSLFEGTEGGDDWIMEYKKFLRKYRRCHQI